MYEPSCARDLLFTFDPLDGFEANSGTFQSSIRSSHFILSRGDMLAYLIVQKSNFWYSLLGKWVVRKHQYIYQRLLSTAESTHTHIQYIFLD